MDITNIYDSFYLDGIQTTFLFVRRWGGVDHMNYTSQLWPISLAPGRSNICKLLILGNPPHELLEVWSIVTVPVTWVIAMGICCVKISPVVGFDIFSSISTLYDRLCTFFSWMTKCPSHKTRAGTTLTEGATPCSSLPRQTERTHPPRCTHRTFRSIMREGDFHFQPDVCGTYNGYCAHHCSCYVSLTHCTWSYCNSNQKLQSDSQIYIHPFLF